MSLATTNGPLLVAVRGCDRCGSGCLVGYEPSPTPVEAARSGWHEVVVTAFAHPSLAVLLGASLGSLLCARLGVAPFHVHVHGPAGSGRSLAVRCAASVAGHPDVVIHDAQQHLAHRADAVAPMPLVLSGIDDPTLTSIGSEPDTVVFTTGTDPLPDAFNLPAPLTRDPGSLALVHMVAAAHSGWPAMWASETPLDGEVGTWFAVTRKLLSRASVPDLEADRLALAAVGFGALGRLADRGFAFYAGLGAALRLVETRQALRIADALGVRLLRGL